MTPYWEDGAISTAEEEGRNRANSLRLQQLTTLYAMLDPQRYEEQAFYEAWKHVLLFHEHTWGAHNSISQPDLPFVTEQWRIKKQFLTDAETQIHALEHNLLEPLRDPHSKKIMVFNTCSWTRSGLVRFPATAEGRSVKTAQGALFPLQQLSTGEYVFIAVDVPALGAVVYEISMEAAPATNTPFQWNENSISNGKLTAVWDEKGSITALKTTGAFNYAGVFNGQGLNSYWYVPGLDPREAQTNAPMQAQLLERGPVLHTIRLDTREAPGAHQLEKRISLTAGGAVLLLEDIVDKKAVRSKEAVHFGFPFHESLSRTTIDAGYGTMQYLNDQLPGSNMDYLCARRWLDISAVDRGLQWLLLEMPLVEPAAMIDERLTINQSHKAWLKQGRAASTWFSYAMNNYWHTNYKIDQEGPARFRYALHPYDRTGDTDLEKAAAEFTQPLIATPVQEAIKTYEGLFELTNTDILATSVTPVAGGGLVIRLFNPGAGAAQTAFKWKTLRPSAVTEALTGKTLHKDDSVVLAGRGIVELMVLEQK